MDACCHGDDLCTRLINRHVSYIVTAREREAEYRTSNTTLRRVLELKPAGYILISTM